MLAQTLQCVATFVAYVVPCAMVLFPVCMLTRVPSYVFRKLLHTVAFSCVTVMVMRAQSWQAAALASCAIAVAVWPLLRLAERFSWYGRLFVQKSYGEVRRSLLMLFGTVAVLVGVAWGVFGRPELAAAAILMWGPGDGAAALVGIPWGRHKVGFGAEAGAKSWEGTLAMCVTAFVCGAAVLAWGGVSPADAVRAALVGAPVGAAVELVSPSELDTVTVPAALLLVLLVAAC